MKLFFRSVSIALVLLIAAVYMNGCTTAEQTTAKLAFQQGDYAKAETEFAKETVQNPANEEAWYYLGASRLLLKKYDDAKVAFDQYRKIGKNTYSNEILEAWTNRFNRAADAFELGQKTKDNDIKLNKLGKQLTSLKYAKSSSPIALLLTSI
jgi:tetratricopeptide (TPR) repeat protein